MDDRSHSVCNGNVNMNADTDHHLSPEKMIKVEPLAEITATPLLQIKQESTADATADSFEKSNTEKCEVKILKVENAVNETISSEADDEENDYEFVGNEPDIDDPQQLSEPNCKAKGKIKLEKQSTLKKTTSFSCKICSYKTNKKLLLSSHLISHSNERPYKCDRCEMSFKTKGVLRNHINIHLGHKPHACNSCDMTFHTAYQLKTHERWRHTLIKPYKCTECDYSSVVNTLLRRHMRLHTGERPYKCPHCTYAAREKSKLNSHMRSHTDERPYQCSHCAYDASDAYRLKIHIRTHTGEKLCDETPSKCYICEKVFKKKVYLKSHLNIHLGRKPYACTSCDKAFVTSKELKAHELRRHTNIKPYKCNDCNDSFVTKYQLHCHVRKHTGEKPFHCPHCSYAARIKRELSLHMRLHTGEKPHQCPHCTYDAPNAYRLRTHIRRHTGEKPYECDICHARFRLPDYLKNHRLRHSVNEKKGFQCNLCPTKCIRKSNLLMHIKNLHSSNQPIPCEECDKASPDRYTHKIHMKTHRGENQNSLRREQCSYESKSQHNSQAHVSIHLDAKPFECETCGTSFRLKAQLSHHMKRIHHLLRTKPPNRLRKDISCPHCDRKFSFHGHLLRHMETHHPDTQRLEQKDEIKLEGLERVKADGTVVTISNETVDASKQEQQMYDKETKKVFEEAYVYNDVDNKPILYDECKAEECKEEIDRPQEDNSQTTMLIEIKQEIVQPIHIDQTLLKKADIKIKNEE